MPELNFEVQDAEPQRHAAEPSLLFRLRLTEKTTTPIHAVMLRCQFRIEPGRRRYSNVERAKLLDLFGTPERWGQTLRPMLWTQVSVAVPSFTGSAVIDLPVPCSYDFGLAATKYFDALEDGEIPLAFLFSGTFFYEGEASLRIGQIPWDKEAGCRLPAATWRSLMDLYYPNSVWLRLRKHTFEQLAEYKRRRGLPTWEQALDELLVNQVAT
jgi:hypothetical protein